MQTCTENKYSVYVSSVGYMYYENFFLVCALPILFLNHVIYTVPENSLMPLYAQPSVCLPTIG